MKLSGPVTEGEDPPGVPARRPQGVLMSLPASRPTLDSLERSAPWWAYAQATLLAGLALLAVPTVRRSGEPL